MAVNMENIEYQNNSIVVNDSSISFSSNRDSQHDSNENNHLPFVNQDDSMSEQDIRDILFDAGYTIEDINEIITLKSESNESACQSKPGNASTASATNSTSGYSSSARAMDRKSGNVNSNRNCVTVEAGSNLKYQDNSHPAGSSEIGSILGSDASADEVLKEIRIKNVNRVTIGTLNINSLAPKFEQLRTIIGKNLDILTIQETKLDSSFPSGQFVLEGYSESYRLDRNRKGGRVIIHVREDIPS